MFWLGNKEIKFSLHTLNLSPVICGGYLNLALHVFAIQMKIAKIKDRKIQFSNSVTVMPNQGVLQTVSIKRL